MFPTRSVAWPPLSVHQGIAPSIFLFYNMKLCYEDVEYSEEEAMLKRGTAITVALSRQHRGLVLEAGLESSRIALILIIIIITNMHSNLITKFGLLW